MKISIRKVRGSNDYAVKVDNVLLKVFDSKDKALEYVETNKNNLEELKNSNIVNKQVRKPKEQNKVKEIVERKEPVNSN